MNLEAPLVDDFKSPAENHVNKVFFFFLPFSLKKKKILQIIDVSLCSPYVPLPSIIRTFMLYLSNKNYINICFLKSTLKVMILSDDVEEHTPLTFEVRLRLTLE